MAYEYKNKKEIAEEFNRLMEQANTFQEITLVRIWHETALSTLDNRINGKFFICGLGGILGALIKIAYQL